MNSGLIRQCNLVSPGIHLEGATIEVAEGRIRALHPEGADLPDIPILADACNQTVLPGFIDIHTHGALSRDVCDGKPDALETIGRAKIREGVTTFLPTTLTVSEECLQETATLAADYMRSPTFAKAPGLHIEGPFINPNCAGAQNPEYVRPPSVQEIDRIRKVAPISIISIAPEMDGGSEFIAAMKVRGITVSIAHTAATHHQVRAAADHGATHLTHFCNQMTPMHHREIGVVGAGLLADDLMIEVICDKVHLCPDMIALVFKVKSMNQMMLVTDSIAASWMPDSSYDLGGLNVVVTNGEARLPSGALAGSTLRYHQAVKNVAEITGIELEHLSRATGFNQSRSLGWEGVGELKVGAAADIVVLDEQFNPTAVFVDGVDKLPESSG
jgi:N-acetylglucosamine-6-phosphate deacetylase